MRLFSCVLVALLLAAPAIAGTSHPAKCEGQACHVIRHRSVTRTITPQSIAVEKALYMARLGVTRHVRMELNRNIPGWAFEGVGSCTGCNTPPTCVPNRRLRLVADATVIRNRTKYRCRIWAR